MSRSHSHGFCVSHGNIKMPSCAHISSSSSSTSSSSDLKRQAITSNGPLLPGLPDDLSVLCLARVPSLSLLWRVSPLWQVMISYSSFFHLIRAELGFKPQLWLYALLCDTHTLSPSVPPSQHDNHPHDPDGSCPLLSWFAFDPLANRWHRLPPFPPVQFQLTSPSFIGLLHSVQCASSINKIFMVAGSRRTGSTIGKSSELNHGSDHMDRQPLEPALECPFIFDTQTQTWTQGAPFRVPRKWCACGVLSGKLIIASGCGRDWGLSVAKSAEMYDPDHRKWVILDDLKSSKFSGEAISAVNYDGKLHMVSGKGVFWKVGVIYDPQSGRWSDMPRGMCQGWNGPCVVIDSKLHVLEGCTGRLKAYNADEDSWTTVMRDAMLKNMEQLVGCGPGKLCGIVRAPLSSSSHKGDAIQIVDIRGVPMIDTLQPPLGQIVALQVLSRICLPSEGGF